ncbi:MAG TPA: hypothetical protein V6D08_00785 [Candidatus Obscuribacterales bacterium]
MAESDISKPESAASGGGPAPAQGAGAPGRRAGFKNFLAAIKHINEASVADTVKQRFSDYVTIGLVVVCILSLVAAVALPVPQGLKLLPLLFTVGAIVFYIINRLGIILSLTSRQALIVWQILIAAFWLGVTSAMLVMMACVYFFTKGVSQY